jgi:hypothetical protein
MRPTSLEQSSGTLNIVKNLRRGWNATFEDIKGSKTKIVTFQNSNGSKQ